MVQLSLKAGLDPETHLALGRALAPLRDQDVLIVGSGLSYHNLRQFFSPRGWGPSREFDGWLRGVLLGGSPKDRDKLLADWEAAPAARAAHPREEHLLPLMVAAGAAGDGRGAAVISRRKLPRRPHRQQLSIPAANGHEK